MPVGASVVHAGTGLVVPAQNDSPADDRSPRVLVVDDDPQIRKLIIASLRRDHYELSEAGNGRGALEAMRRGDTDCVILDLMMPEVSGWDVLEQRAQDPNLRRIPVVVISANRGPELAKAVGQDIAAFVPKPFDLDTLHAVVQSCVRARKK
jgi:CheY-like chemotaxis protein